MKKLLLIIAALFTLSGASANLIFHESFDREVGTLNKGANKDMGTNMADWWCFSGTKDYISVVNGSLSHDGYATAKGNKVELLGNGADDFRQFAPITDGKVYLAAIINVDSLKATGTTPDYFLCLGDGGTSKMVARLCFRNVQENGKSVGFNLGITKESEFSKKVIGWSSTEYQPKTDYLVVLEYEFVSGDKNDTCRLYVNPLKEDMQPTAVCIQVDSVKTGGSLQPAGANTKDDATQIASVNLRKSTNTPGRVYVDEIKVATTWEDLFAEGGDTPIENNPELTVTPATLSFASGMPYIGETYTATFTVTGKNLKSDITLTSDNAELTLNKSAIAKADAETEAGVVVTATLTPVKVDGQKANITLTTEGATATVTSSWWTTDVKACATVAELKAQAATASGWDYAYMRFTGEAIVTYKFAESNGATTLYLEDNTAAISVSDTYWNDAVKQGDKVTGFAAYTYADAAVGGALPITPLNATITVLSSDNDVTPQVVTLADLKANAADYLLELVKIEGVTFDNTTELLASGTQISQGDNTATINLVAGNDLIGAAKPAKADIVGISSSAAGTVIRMRGIKDLSAVPSAIDNITINDLMSGNYEIYTVSGQRIDALQQGVNIIRQGNNTYKIVR